MITTRLRFLLVCSLSTVTATSKAWAQPLSMEQVNRAEYKGRGEVKGAALLKLQILLDRARTPPGQIDGKLGENTRKAIKGPQLC